MKMIALCLAATLACAPALATEAQRQETIAKIIQAQGLQDMFQQQIDQSQAYAVEMGQNAIQQILQETGAPQNKEDPRLAEAFKRYLERCASMFTAKEMTTMWATAYGKDLSDAELKQILAYYRSPTGKKDVQASQVAMATFSKAMLTESEKRLNASVSQLLSDIKAVIGK